MFNIAEELFRTYDLLGNGSSYPRTVTRGNQYKESWLPVNIKETETGYSLKALVPGFTKDEVFVSVEDNTLTLGLEKGSAPGKEDSVVLLFNEIPNISKYSRKIKLPKAIDTESVKATLEEGVLLISLTKRSVLTSKRILIE